MSLKQKHNIFISLIGILVLVMPFMVTTITMDSLLIKFYFILFFIPILLIILFNGYVPSLFNPALLVLSLYFFISIISAFRGQSHTDSGKGVLYFLYEILIIFASWGMLKKNTDRKKIFFLMILAMSINSIFFIMQNNNTPLIFGSHRWFVHNSLGNPNVFAHCLVMTIPLTLLFIIPPYRSIISPIISAILLLLQCYALKETQSRAGILAVTTALLYASLIVFVNKIKAFRFLKNTLLQLIIIIVILFAGVSFTVIGKQNTIESLFNFESADSLRYAAWKDAMKIWEDGKIFGVGFNQFAFNMQRMVNERSNDEKKLLGAITVQRVHNDHLQYLVERGIAGLGVWLLLLFFCFSITNKYPLSPCILFVFTSILATIIHSTFDFNLHMPVSETYFFILVGALFSFLPDNYRPFTVKKTVFILTVIVSIFFVFFPLSEYVSFVYFNRAKSAHDSNKYKIASPFYDKAMILAPKYFLLPFRAGLIKEDEENLSEAQHLMQNSIELDPYYPNSRYHLASILFKEKKYNEAGIAFRASNAIKSAPESIMNNGHVFFSRGDYTRSMNYYRYANFQDPELSEPMELLAKINKQNNDFSEASLWIKKLLTIHPDKKDYLLLWSEWTVEHNNEKEWADLFNWLSREWSLHSEEYYYVIANHFFNESKPDITKKIITEAKRNGLQTAGLLYLEGKLAFISNDYVNAENLFKESVALDNRFGKSYLFLGHLSSFKGNWNQAIKSYEAARISGLETYEVLFNIGLCFNRLGDAEKSKEYLTRSLEKNPADGIKLRALEILKTLK